MVAALYRQIFSGGDKATGMSPTAAREILRAVRVTRLIVVP
jgi:hypothetical protein